MTLPTITSRSRLVLPLAETLFSAALILPVGGELPVRPGGQRGKAGQGEDRLAVHQLEGKAALLAVEHAVCVLGLDHPELDGEVLARPDGEVWDVLVDQMARGGGAQDPDAVSVLIDGHIVSPHRSPAWKSASRSARSASAA